jgi:hypothetical protein
MASPQSSGVTADSVLWSYIITVVQISEESYAETMDKVQKLSSNESVMLRSAATSSLATKHVTLNQGGECLVWVHSSRFLSQWLQKFCIITDLGTIDCNLTVV